MIDTERTQDQRDRRNNGTVERWIGVEEHVSTEHDASYCLYCHANGKRSGVTKLKGVNAAMKYDVYYEFEDGSRKCVSWPCFISPFDVSACLALIASAGLPKNVIRAVAEDSNGQWIAEAVRAGLETQVRTKPIN